MEHCRFNAIRKENLKCSINEFFCEGCGVCAYVCKNEAVSLSDDTAGRQAVYREDIVLSTAELKMGRGNSGKLVSAVKKEMIKAAPEAELAGIDGSPGIGCPVISSVNGVDLVLIVAEPSLSGASDLKRLLKTITTFGTKAAVCVNKWDVSPENTEAVEELCRVCDVPFAGKIPYDKTAYEAINSGRSIAEFDCPAKDAIIKVFNKTMSMF